MEAIKPLQTLLESLEARIKALECTKSPPTSSKTSDDSSLSPHIIAYDEYVRQYLPPFVRSCQTLGQETSKLGDITQKAFDAQREFLYMASQCKKPAQITPKLLQGVQDCLKELNFMRSAPNAFSNHVKMVNEGIQALGWLCEEPAPKPFVESYIGALDFWGNKIRVEFKGKDENQIQFVTTFKSLLVELMDHVKCYHVTGVSWNGQGKDISEYEKQSSSNTPSGGINDVFTSITSANKGAGEKSTAKDLKIKSSMPQGSASQKTATASTKKPISEQRNCNWHIENQIGDTIEIKDLQIRQQVYIYGCQDAVILLEGKCKNIVLDSCKSTKLLFDQAVSSLEIVNCRSVQAQCKGKIPSVAIDKTDGCQLYVSWEGRDVHLVTSKSSEMNVLFPANADTDELIEKPIPEQFVHRITEDFSISSTVSDLYS